MLNWKIVTGTLVLGLCFASVALNAGQSGLRSLTESEAMQVVAGQSSSSCTGATLTGTYGCQDTYPNGDYKCPYQAENASFSGKGKSKPLDAPCFYYDSQKKQQSCGDTTLSQKCK